MCGLAGILHRGAVADARDRVARMAASIRHRGPDDERLWSDGDLALGFVRLAIVDLEGGAQPMANEDGTVIAVYNGEIYNHRELRVQLCAAGHRFVSDHADTEVLVHGWEEWGERLPERLNGMFAFAIWDTRMRSLFLARDRYGIKPLYRATTIDGAVLFASEIRALHASRLVTRAVNPSSVVEYLSHQNLWGHDTFFAGVTLFPAGTWERIDAGGSRRARYWDYRFPRSQKLSLADAARCHREILYRAVTRQIQADVPVMSYLSGGIDSSAICASAFQLDPRVCAYSCLFDLDGVREDRVVDERAFARRVASSLGIEHRELELPQDALVAALRPTIRALEDPRMGPSYENFLIAERVARDGKVVLSGTGGDELHGGYVDRYAAIASARRLGARSAWRDVARRLLGRRTPVSRVALLTPLLNVPIAEAHLREAVTPELLAAATVPSVASRIDALLRDCQSDEVWDALMYVDARAYLHGLLVLEDKLSMAHGLEARVPLLDNELVDFMCDLPWSLLVDGAMGKIVFRESVRPLVPDDIYRKPKMGFGPPDASWYRGKLRPFVTATLAPDRIARRGVLQPAFVTRTLTEHFEGRANRAALIWSLLSLEAWCEEFNLLGGVL